MRLFSKKKPKTGEDSRSKPDSGSCETYKTANGETVTVQYAPGAKERLHGIDLDALLCDVAGVGPCMQTEPGDFWSRFDSLSEKEKKKALRHSFTIKNWSGAGWEYPTVQLDGETYHYGASYIGPGIGAFIGEVNRLSDGESRSFFWQSEPGLYEWYFERRGDIVYVQIPKAPQGVYMKYAFLRKQVNTLEGRYVF